MVQWKGGRTVSLEKVLNLCSALTFKLECFNSELCKITARAHCVMTIGSCWL